MKTFGAWILLLAACFLSGTACSERTLTPLEGRILFSVGESYRNMSEAGPPAIIFRLETEKVYGCCNYSLVTQLARVGGDVVADIQGVEAPGICLTALGPACFGDFIDLENGRYVLTIRDGRGRSEYQLTVDEDSLAILGPAEAGWAAPKYSVFWRYPRDSFAVLCGTTTETAWIYEDFLARLGDAVELREIEFAAFGERCYPRAPQGHGVDHPGRYFVYEGQEDFAAAGEVLRAYVRDVIGPIQGVGITLLNWRNESFRSWLMD